MEQFPAVWEREDHRHFRFLPTDHDDRAVPRHRGTRVRDPRSRICVPTRRALSTGGSRVWTGSGIPVGCYERRARGIPVARSWNLLGPGEPQAGYNFTGWTSSSGVYVFAPATNYTWVNVSAAGGAITAHYAATPLTAVVWLAAYPSQGGQIQFGPFTYNSGAIFSAPQGTYSVRAIPAPGFQFLTWAPGFMSTMTNFSESSNILVQYGDDYVTAVFSSVPVLQDSPRGSGSGYFEINGQPTTGPNISLPEVGNVTYQLEAFPSIDSTFSHWSVQNRKDAWIANLSAPLTSIQVNGSTTISPHFTAAPHRDSFHFVMNGQGVVSIDNAYNIPFTFPAALPIPAGTWYLSERPATGFTFAGFSTTGNVSVGIQHLLTLNSLADVENLAGVWVSWYSFIVEGNGTLTANFVPIAYPVTFIDFPYDAHASLLVVGTSSVTVIHAGKTAYLAPGDYTMALIGESVTGLRWFANSNLTFSPQHGYISTLTVGGSGTIYAVGSGGSGSGISHVYWPPAAAVNPVLGQNTSWVRKP